MKRTRLFMFRLLRLFRYHRRVILFFCEMLLWNLSYYLSFGIHKNNFSLHGVELPFFTGLAVMNISFAVVFLLFRLYDKLWRYADTEDFFYAAIASLTANIVFMTGMMITGAAAPALAMNSKIFVLRWEPLKAMNSKCQLKGSNNLTQKSKRKLWKVPEGRY